MATYTYTANVRDIETLQHALINEGVYDAEISIVENGDKEVSVTTSSSQTLVDDAVSSATEGGLICVQADKINEVLAKSVELIETGVSFTRPSDSAVKTGLPATKEARTELRQIKQDYTDALITLPQMFNTLDGRGVEMFTSADIDAMIAAIVTRRLYVFNDATNGDSSRGEAGLIKDILAETTVAGVEAITDTRT